MKRFQKVSVTAKSRKGTTNMVMSPICKVCGKAGTLRRLSNGKMGLAHKCEPPAPVNMPRVKP